jgi:hypothetical protein
MFEYYLIELFNKFGLLDNNTQVVYIIILLIILFIIYNLIPVSSKLFNSLILTLFLSVLILSQKYKSIDYDLKSINKINTSLDLKNYKYISSDLEICTIYYDIIEFRNIDKYSFMNSLIDTNKYIEIYFDIKNKNKDYSQLLDIAMEKKDSAINHLLCISNSISPNIGIIANTDKIVQNSLENKLIEKVNELRSILDKYWFDILNICRTVYETTPINIMSRPITFDINTPNPNTKHDTFDIYYGNVDP